MSGHIGIVVQDARGANEHRGFALRASFPIDVSPRNELPDAGAVEVGRAQRRDARFAGGGRRHPDRGSRLSGPQASSPCAESGIVSISGAVWGPYM